MPRQIPPRIVRGLDRFKNKLIHDIVLVTIAVLVCACLPQRANALITGGTDKRPIAQQGWPAGADAVFNTPARIAYWEGPPFGGGQWHAECRGTTEQLQKAINDFAKVASQEQVIVLLDGVGSSFWLNPNREAGQAKNAVMDWQFMVWQEQNWKRLQSLPAGLRPTGKPPRDHVPAPRLTVYTGGQIEWSKIQLPPSMTVLDQRLESNGYRSQDGRVLAGQILAEDGKALVAEVSLQLITPRPKGGYSYRTVRSTTCRPDGRWVMTKLPQGWHRLIGSADGYASRVLHHIRVDDQPGWESLDSTLAPQAEVRGRILDKDLQPIANAVVRFRDVALQSGEHYPSSASLETQTDETGRFRAAGLPRGTVRVTASKDGYVLRGLGPTIQSPADAVTLHLERAGELTVQVNFDEAPRKGNYIVNVEPEAGSAVGRWGGSANLNEQDQVVFRAIPSGSYVVKGRPNPGSAKQETLAVTVQIVGGRTHVVTLKAR